MADYETYKVAAGDTLGGIAARHAVSVSSLVSLNALSSANSIRIGQVLKVREVIAVRRYTVKAGDTLIAIARAYGVTAAEIMTANRLSNANAIAVGQVLSIPAAQTTAVPASPPPPPPPPPPPRPSLVKPGAELLKAAQIARTLVEPRSINKDWLYVRKALLQAKVIDTDLTGTAASEAGPQLLQRGFSDILYHSDARIRSPYDAPVGAVLVYKAARTATDANRSFGHIEFRTADGFASDYFSPRARTGLPANGLSITGPSGRTLIGVWVIGNRPPPPPPPLVTPYAPENLKLSAANAPFRAGVLEAAAKTNMAPQTIAAIIDAEAAKRPDGSWNPDSKAGTTSASGLTQFLKKTWRDEAVRAGGLLNAEAKALALVDADNLIRDDDGLLALRFDGRVSILAGADLARVNLRIMRNAGVLPANVDPAGMAKLAYLAHHEGPGRAGRLLKGDTGYVDDALFAANVTNKDIRDQWLAANGGKTGLAYRAWLADYADRKIDVTRFMVSASGVAVPKLSSFFV